MKGKTFGFYAGRAWEKWDASSPERSGIGGSETCLVRLSSELARLGHETYLFVDTERASETDNGAVHYLPYGEIEKFAEKKFDCFVHYRSTRLLNQPLKADLRVGLAQDITMSVPNGSRDLRGKLDLLVGLSHAHVHNLSAFHSFPRERVLLSANGVDPDRFAAAEGAVSSKKKSRVFYSSCPSRGLSRLLMLCERVQKHVPDFELIVAYGWQTWEGLIAAGAGDRAEYEWTRNKIAASPWVTDLGRVDQRKLAELQMSSRAWLYPTSFPETFCITAAEAGFARCAILSTPVFGLESTVGDGGILLRTTPGSAEFGDFFTAHAVRLLTDDVYWSHWSTQAWRKMRKYTWAAVARQWDGLLKTGQWPELT